MDEYDIKPLLDWAFAKGEEAEEKRQQVRENYVAEIRQRGSEIDQHVKTIRELMADVSRLEIENRELKRISEGGKFPEAA